MKNVSPNEQIIHICKYVLNYIRDRQKILEADGSFQNRMALLEEYREWISEGINKDFIFYLNCKNEISDKT